MKMDASISEALTDFTDNWTQDPNNTKDCFLTFKAHLESLDDVNISFVPRPGITYSLRGTHINQKKRELFVMVDVIDDDPADRWLSVCFYGEMVSDPEESGDEVPEGLMGEDAKCFDLYEGDDATVEYVKARISEAAVAASKE